MYNITSLLYIDEANITGESQEEVFITMNYVFVVDTKHRPLSMCHPARARMLLKSGKAAVLRRYPFTIILKEEKPDAVVKPMRVKIDPGSKVTGFALVDLSDRVLFAAELEHRGQVIKLRLQSRRVIRHNRRNRKTRYRKMRFYYRRKIKGWLSPSLLHRVKTIITWVNRFCIFCNVIGLSVEKVKFDMALMINPEISGIEYQQGTLFGYTVREYLLEKWGRKCSYCGKENVPLQIEHIQPKRRNGSNTISNLALACEPCNTKKGILSIEVFLKDKPDILKIILEQVKKPLNNAAAVNITRNKLYGELLKIGLPVEVGTGAYTKFNRVQSGYPKAHWVDAACVGGSGVNVKLNILMKPLLIKAMGHGNRQVCRINKYGFPIRYCNRQKQYFGFKTGDQVIANITNGKNRGTHKGRVVCRATGSFNIQTKNGCIGNVSYKRFIIVQKNDGYAYSC